MISETLTKARGKGKSSFIGLERPAVAPIGFGVISSGVDDVTLSFYWSPPEAEDQRHVLFRATLNKEVAKALVDSLSEYLAKVNLRATKKEPSRLKGSERPENPKQTSSTGS